MWDGQDSFKLPWPCNRLIAWGNARTTNCSCKATCSLTIHFRENSTEAFLKMVVTGRDLNSRQKPTAPINKGSGAPKNTPDKPSRLARLLVTPLDSKDVIKKGRRGALFRLRCGVRKKFSNFG